MRDTTSGDQFPADDPTRPGPSLHPDAETVLQATMREGGSASVPFTLGRYRVTQRIGAGGFGTVYKAFDEDLAREVAIKVFRADHLSPGHDLTAYQAEGRALASLDHPGIVPVYDVGRSEIGRAHV